MAVPTAAPESIQFLLDALKYGGLALAAGALEKVGADAYANLLGRLRKILANRRDGNLVLDRYLEDWETWISPLQKELSETNAFSDPQLQEVARQVMATINNQVAAGKFNIQMGPGGQIGQLIRGENVYISPASTPTAPTRAQKPMGMKAFEQLVKPKLIREGWEVSTTTLEKLPLKALHDWEEVFEEIPDGRPTLIVITVGGVVDAIPIRRHRLSPNAIRLLVAALQHGGSRPHSLWFREYIGPDSPSFGVEDVQLHGADAEYAKEELLRYDLISEQSKGYYLLTSRGRKRAEDLTSVGILSS